MSWFSNKSVFPWIQLTSEDSVSDLIEKSFLKPVILFKHSTRCSISSMALSRFEREWDITDHANLFLLDLITFRQLSNDIAQQLKIEHQSPQIIVLIDGQVKLTSSHNSISAKEIKLLI